MTALPITASSRALHNGTRTLHRMTRLSAPATAAYLIVLVTTTAVLSTASAHTDNQLLLDVSTNLHQLAHVPLRVLFASAFWTSGWWDLALWAATFAAIVVPAERRLGWRRTTIAFAAGHVGATLIVAAGLWIGIQLGVANPADVLAQDVGVSYGFFAVVALAAYLLPSRYRILYLAITVSYLLAAAAFSHTFTDFGHLTAVAIGLASYPLVRARPAPVPVGPLLQPRPPQTGRSFRGSPGRPLLRTEEVVVPGGAG